jgi:hypothetical protein
MEISVVPDVADVKEALQYGFTALINGLTYLGLPKNGGCPNVENYDKPYDFGVFVAIAKMMF